VTPPPGQPARLPTPQTPPPSPVPLDWGLLSRALAGAPLGHAFHYLEQTASTNDVALRLAAGGAPEGTVVVADSQTAGRGRAGKSPWLTPPRTSIAVSILLRPPPAFPATSLPRLGMAAGVAAAEAAREEAGVATGLKWPNDVLAWAAPPPAGAPPRSASPSGAPSQEAAPGKLGGVLVESALQGGAVAHAVVGIGLNVNLPAASLGPFADTTLPPTSILDLTGHPASRENLLLRLLQALSRIVQDLYAGRGGDLLARYVDLQTVLGQPVRLSAGRPPSGEIVEGIAEGITPDGALLLRLPGGERRAFAYGEVTLRPKTPPAPTAGRRPSPAAPTSRP
jgi:BirA family biotin operon repressor/biotin-[acetyl-CoA-carboxylase] ligase